MRKQELIEYFNTHARSRDRWKRRNWYYHKTLTQLFRFLIPDGSTVLEVGSGIGDLLASLKPSRGLGIDISKAMFDEAHKKYPRLEWRVEDAENLALGERFDYVVASDLVGFLDDIERAFYGFGVASHERTRLVVTYYNYLWEPILRLAEFLHLKARQPLQNWMSQKDIENMLTLAGFEVIKSGNKMIFPIYIPIISAFLNVIVANLPLVSRLGVIQYIVARPRPEMRRDYSVLIIV